MVRDIKMQRNITKVISVSLMIAIVGCTMSRNQKAVEMEKLLDASGFKMRIADDENKLAQLKELPQRKLVARNWGGKVRYVYVDASKCKCAYIGDEKAYKNFQELVLRRRIAEEDRRAAERDNPSDMDGGGWLFNKSW